ncbi:MAG TPA: DUF1203 domain-containing protein [Dongiaceae bacterium]|jgi:hypothetical protein|nr:DUF1203 domain-containing protein [Dongiaceae bacterium]
MSFRISSLPVEPFQPLFGLSDDELMKRGARRAVADQKPGFPCRVTLADAEPGETLLLLNYPHLAEPSSPFRATGPIFVRESALGGTAVVDSVPDYLARRILSVRAYDAGGMMLDADVVEGRELAPSITRFFGNDDVAYLHAHFAKRGCYAARIDRA